ncbi:hypothetical protein IMCC14465_16550 [alpha proteobacterium IMCC14465]|uniref:2-amino-4-hydroxy-6-hydroxymethyldihydropteridine pyrophosphokinase n=1 Tax=alpha proteobacterium IMCC14465 TaxID=1220535 RepID=J9A2K8_9PROT|nr:hypothetical protein IMCC14465_16550 [alpha proteobacterium IMCC14465]
MILVGIGSNLSGKAGSPIETVKESLRAMQTRGMTILTCSDFYDTPPVGPSGQGHYVNAVVRLGSVIGPHGLLRELQTIENQFGRQRSVKWGARTLDLDVLDWHGHLVHGRLNLPHPEISRRGFVLRPLMDVAPEWRHPETGLSVRALWNRLSVTERLKIMKL